MTFRRIALIILIVLSCLYLVRLFLVKLEIGGASPNQRRVGKVQYALSRNILSDCSDVTVTPQSTWLTSSYYKSLEATPDNAHPIDIDAQVRREIAASSERAGSRNEHEPAPSALSRLNAQGRFELVATVGSDVCLLTSPDGQTLYLLTNSKRGADDAVIRSDDQGKTWGLLRKGFMGANKFSPQALQLNWFGTQELWSVASGDADIFGTDAEAEASTGSSDPSNSAVALFHSNDRGSTAQRVPLPRSLLVSATDACSNIPSDMQCSHRGEAHANIVQLDAHRAVLWASQSFAFGRPGDRYNTDAVLTSSRVELLRINGRWQSGEPQRLENIWIDAVKRTPAGHVIGVIRHAGDKRERIALLESSTLTWVEQGALPSPFDPLPASAYAHGFWAGQETLVVNVSSTHYVPKWIYPWGNGAQISNNAVYYSRDWGRSWHRLAISGSPGVQGVAGFDAMRDEVFWPERRIYSASDWGKDWELHSYGLR